MSEPEARDEMREVVKKHSQDLDPADLRALAEDLRATADEWEGVQL